MASKIKSSRRLKRTRLTYEFIVKHPYGAAAISGYQKAARHFGLHTRADPTTKGTDQFQLLVDRDPKKLRDTARQLSNLGCAASERDDDGILNEEFDILLMSGVAWFAQDFNWWDVEGDEGALEHLGWARIVEKRTDGSFYVTLRRHSKQKTSRRKRT